MSYVRKMAYKTVMLIILEESWKGTDDENPRSPSGRTLPKGRAGPRSVNFECTPLRGLRAGGSPFHDFWIELGLMDKPQQLKDLKQQQSKWMYLRFTGERTAVQRVVGFDRRFLQTRRPKIGLHLLGPEGPTGTNFVGLTHPSRAG